MYVMVVMMMIISAYVYICFTSFCFVLEFLNKKVLSYLLETGLASGLFIEHSSWYCVGMIMDLIHTCISCYILA